MRNLRETTQKNGGLAEPGPGHATTATTTRNFFWPPPPPPVAPRDEITACGETPHPDQNELPCSGKCSWTRHIDFACVPGLPETYDYHRGGANHS